MLNAIKQHAYGLSLKKLSDAPARGDAVDVFFKGKWWPSLTCKGPKEEPIGSWSFLFSGAPCHGFSALPHCLPLCGPMPGTLWSS